MNAVYTALSSILYEAIQLLHLMAPYLLFGFFCGGILHIFVSSETIAQHLGKDSTGSVIKAALFGIPLPLCSCGVLSTALSLRKSGASKGAILSFLISTPTTSIDSVFATYSLLGPLFAGYRVVASFLTGVCSGLMANIFARERNGVGPQADQEGECKICEETETHVHSFAQKVRALMHYAFVELLEGVGKWLLIGIAVGGVISYLMPEDFFSHYIAEGWQAIVVMLIAGIPLYVCATGSIPIAAALMLKGMNPGAAFVFLLAGPATNAVTITVITNSMGKKVAAFYLSAIGICSIALGLLLDEIWHYWNSEISRSPLAHHARILLPEWVEIVSSVLLLVLIAYPSVKRLVNK